MRTWEAVAQLHERAGARTSLEVVAQTTSMDHAGHTAAVGFERHVSLQYRTPEFEPYGPARDLPTLDDLVMVVPGECFDVVYIDPWHTMEHSQRLIRWAFDHVAPGGWLLVHDCWPHRADLLGAFVDNGRGWCGDTWRAFQEFARSQRNAWCVIDDDFGIGVIGPITEPAAVGVVDHLEPVAPDRQWQWLQAHRNEAWVFTTAEWCAALRPTTTAAAAR
ncbi:MAG: class I SAM-dependent methyltransferase [Ilumatobacteraceae bacterium]